MKLPRKSPEFKELLKKVPTVDKLIAYITSGDTFKFNNTSNYIHWDNLIHREPPNNLSHEEWWFLLKNNRRSNAKQLPIKDKKSSPFSFIVNDYMTEQLHKIDLYIGGTLGSYEKSVVSSASKEQYLMRSLMEEAITSSQLEGASTTRMVAKRIIRTGKKPSNNSERMIVNNYKTMQAIRSLKYEKLSKELVFKIHKMVTQGTLETPDQEGRFRRVDELIEVGDRLDGTVYHVPPLSAELEQRMKDMCDFANNKHEDYFIHPVIKAIILHFWLGYDHPFVDGNGRTARALFYWYMLRQGYWLCEYISISEIILKAQSKYISAFLYTETDDNDLTYFIIYHILVIEKAIDSLQEYIKKKESEIKDFKIQIKMIFRFNHRQVAFINHALKHPVGYEYTIKSHMISHDIAYETARSDLNKLVEKGVLESEKIGKTWIYNPVLNIKYKLQHIEEV